MSIAICSDQSSWINAFVTGLLLQWLASGHKCAWAHSAKQLDSAELCFYLSYGRIVDRKTLAKFQHNLVVHESDLPAGKGWSPLTWQILEGKSKIPVTLVEAEAEVDSGVIYAQQWLEFQGHELIDELRAAQADATIALCRWFVERYPASASQGAEQTGEETFYPRRRPKDSELNMDKTLAEQFDVFRVVDHERYPAFFEHQGHTYQVRVRRAPK